MIRMDGRMTDRHRIGMWRERKGGDILWRRRGIELGGEESQMDIPIPTYISL
jgi:hypothetical protein